MKFTRSALIVGVILSHTAILAKLTPEEVRVVLATICEYSTEMLETSTISAECWSKIAVTGHVAVKKKETALARDLKYVLEEEGKHVSKQDRGRFQFRRAGHKSALILENGTVFKPDIEKLKAALAEQKRKPK